jgi:predicted Zn-dependent protease
VERFPRQNWAVDSLKQLFTQQKNTLGFRRLYQVISRHDPADRVAKNNYAILSMLVLKDLRKAHELAAEVYKAEPTNPTFVSTYAFSLHMQGRTAEGVSLLKTLPPATLQEPSMALYYGVLLAATGQQQDAKSFLEKSQQGFMLPEELALLSSARGQLH